MNNLFGSLIKFLDRSKKTVLLILVVAVIAIILSSMVSIWLSEFHNLRIPSIGTLHTLGVEAYGGNITLEDGEQIIDWGSIYLGTLTNRSFYIESKSNIEIILKLETLNWTFLDSNGKKVTDPTKSYMNLTWDLIDTPISPGEVIYVTLSLRASDENSFIDYVVDNNVKGFSFEINIYPSEG